MFLILQDSKLLFVYNFNIIVTKKKSVCAESAGIGFQATKS